MPEPYQRNRLLSRRELLRAGVGGICALGLGGLAGCNQPTATEELPVATGAQRGFMRPVPSPWFSELAGGRVRCELCPKRCELAEGQRALCRVRENRGGVGYTLAYGNPALLQEDPVERKPFFHVLPGSRALSIATAGCNLACSFCEVWDMAQVAPEEVHAHDMPPEVVLQHATESDVRSLSYGFGEPVVFFEYMAALATMAREAGLLNLVHTAGYIEPEPLEQLGGLLDAANVDLKSFDPEFYRQVVGGELDPVLRTLRWLADQGIHIEVTNIVIPTLNDDMAMIRTMCQWIADELGPDVPLHFARFYPLYRLSDLPRTPVSTLEEARNTALDAGLRFVYVARVTGHEGENTFCPTCGEIVIDRVGFVIQQMRLEQGRCTHCGAEIPGRWE